MRPTVATAGLSALLALGFVWPAWSQRPALPEAPANAPDVLATVDGRRAHGHVSDRRTTHDGRVQITKDRFGIRISTVRPEVFRRHLVEERRSTDGPARYLEETDLHASTVEGAVLSHAAICDPYRDDSSRANPYPCRADGTDADCYDVSVLQLVQLPGAQGRRLRTELWSTPITVTVRASKTVRAAVADVEMRGAPVRSPIRRAPARAGRSLLEPITTGDGRLLVANSGDTIVYAVMPPDATACDARNWKKLRHLSSAPDDPAMERYDIARYPVRDSVNRPIPSGRPIRGAYPWIDREGKNVFFMHVATPGLFYRDDRGRMRSRFDVVDRPRNRDIDLAAESASRFGMAFFGAWTQGKIVVPDNRLNAIDFTTGTPRFRPRVRLYDTDPVEATLELSSITHVNSAESQWDHLLAYLGRSPADVAWFVTANNGMTDEVVFDDALRLGTLIWAPMNAPVDPQGRGWYDGFDARGRKGYVRPPRIQNAAAAQSVWTLPDYGELTGGRVEPIAAGGVVGKGLWMDGELGRLEFRVPRQPDPLAMTGATWTTTIWVDPRGPEGRRRLLTFPDGSWLDLEAEALWLGGGGEVEQEVPLPETLRLREGEWRHLGVVSRPDRTDIHVDGMRLATLEGDRLRPAQGRIEVGASSGAAPSAFRGWLDELRVVSGPGSAEQMCNYAGGTLRGLQAGAQAGAFVDAAAYPQATHDAISAALAVQGYPTYERYSCERIRGPRAPCLDDIHRTLGGDPSCVRHPLLFPEGPLFADRPRPDSRGNVFCLSCHAPTNRVEGLQIGPALRPGPPGSDLSDDPRRQPSQAPPVMHGVIPAGTLGFRRPVIAPPDGLPIDVFLYPTGGGSGRIPEDRP